MPVLDALFDHIQQISSNVEITGSLIHLPDGQISCGGAGKPERWRSRTWA
jgi:hypothetical protein